MPDITYLLWSNKHQAWWRPDGYGYTENQDEAGRFSEDDATGYMIRSAHSGVLSQITCMVAAPDNWEPGAGGPLAIPAPISARDAIASALYVADHFGGHKDARHKAWVIDQMVRALCGSDYDYWRAAFEADGAVWDEGTTP